MKSTDSRDLILVPIASQADSEYVRTIPTAQATSGDGSVSMDLGFPPECAISVAAGGKRPEMKDVNGVYNLLSSAIQSLQSYFGPYSADLSTAIGGYPSGAIVPGSAAGSYWVSTTDDNTTVPGATGASWQSLFDGYATESWAEGEFLQLDDAEAQTVTGPVTFEAAPTVPDATAAQNPVALGQINDLTEGRLINSQYFADPGTTTYAPTSGTREIEVWVQGAGGTGGFAHGNDSQNISASGGGSAGAFCIARYLIEDIQADITDGIPITVGAPGAVPVEGEAGGNGGASSFGSLLTAPGGYGGGAGPSNPSANFATWYGQVSDAPSGQGIIFTCLGGAADVLINFNVAMLVGAGGSSFFGPGGPPCRGSTSNTPLGVNACAPGAGGSGAAVAQNQSGVAGGIGGNGIVIVKEFA